MGCFPYLCTLLLRFLAAIVADSSAVSRHSNYDVEGSRSVEHKPLKPDLLAFILYSSNAHFVRFYS